MITVAFFCVGFLFAKAASVTTPFCDKCKCTESLGGVNVDCNGVDVKGQLYDHAYWFNDKNEMYKINSLSVQFNHLRELKTKFLPSNLTLLDLSNNTLVALDKAIFAQLQNLRTLILSHNDLDYLDPEVFRGLQLDSYDYPLRSLSTLRLDHNNFHTLDKDLLRHIPNLEVLSIGNNPFKVIDVNTLMIFSDLYNLKELDLSYAQLHELPENFMHTPKYLRVLDLSGNAFESVPMTLRESHALEILHFDNNPIVNLTKKNGFPKMPTLKTLYLTHMPQLVRIEEEALSGLINLNDLYITDNIELVHLDSASLSRKDEGTENEIWPPLKKLHLENNKLTYIDLHFYVKWDRLSELDIRDNSWTCECENQWMLDELMPALIKINETIAKQVNCAAPVEMQGQTLYDLHVRKTQMRCLDKYGNEPERDAAMLVGILAGLLIGIPLVLFVMYAYQRRCFGYFDTSPAAYSRRFYSRTHSDDL